MDFLDRRRLAVEEIIERYMGWVFEENNDIDEDEKDRILEENTRLMNIEIFNLSWTGFAETNELQIPIYTISIN